MCAIIYIYFANSHTHTHTYIYIYIYSALQCLFETYILIAQIEPLSKYKYIREKKMHVVYL